MCSLGQVKVSGLGPQRFLERIVSSGTAHTLGSEKLKRVLCRAEPGEMGRMISSAGRPWGEKEHEIE